MFIRRELGGTGTGCLFQFTYCVLNSDLRVLQQANNKGTDQPAYSQFDRFLLCSLSRKYNYNRKKTSVAQQARLSLTGKRTPNCRQRVLFSVQHRSMYVFRSSIISNRSCIHVFKPVLSGHSQKELFFKTNYRLMRIKSIEECS